MSREWSTDLQTIHEAYKRRDTLAIYMANGDELLLSRGAVTSAKGTYLNWIRSVSEMRSSIDQAIDRVTITCQNVTSDLGFNLASSLRQLDYATADYGKQYQSLRNLALVEEIPKMFRGVLANGEADEENMIFELIVDYESLGAIIASRGLGPLCSWIYQNGIECTSPSGETSCPKTRAGCFKREVEHEHGGFPDCEQPVTTPPGGGGDDGGGIGNGTCFTLDTPIWTPGGEIPIGELRAGERVVSFHEKSGDIDYKDEIVEVHEHEATGYYTLEFDHGIVNVTPEHPFMVEFGKFTTADWLRLGDTVKSHTHRWHDSTLRKIRWNSDRKIKVRNLHVKLNHTYFANRCAVHNLKPLGGGDIPQNYP
jgi:hypothetical protein